MSLDKTGLDQSNFSRLRERLVDTEVAQRFFELVLRLAKGQRLLSAEHFTVDSMLIESWASLKSLKSLKKKDGPPPKGGGDGTEMVDFKGERRTNATHESTTDPEAKLMRRGWGQPAKLSFAGHALLDNRAGLCADLQITDARMAEPKAAAALLARQRSKRVRALTLGADKGYCSKAFIAHLREHGIRPHIARIHSRRTPGLDERTTRHESYRITQRKRKRIEETFGWLKTVGGLRKSALLASSARSCMPISPPAPTTC